MTLPIDPLVRRRRSSGEDVARLIREWIFDGRLRPGDRVPQDEVAEASGVSRIPVREALIALEREGWVRIELHRGAFVNAIDEDMVRDHFGLLGLVYAFAARRADEHHPAGWEETLLDREKALRAARAPGDLLAAAMAFNDAVIDAAGSERVRLLLRSLPPLVPGVFFEVLPAAGTATRRALLEIGRALRAGEIERAVAQYQELQQTNASLVVKLFDRRGLFSRGR